MSNEDFSDVVFLFTARRTGGTALAHAFEASGFHLFYDPLNPGLANVGAATALTSDGWLSKHPQGFSYFANYEPIPQGFIPKDLDRLSSEWLRKGSEDYHTVRSYFSELITVGRKSLKPICFKIEEINIYEMLKFEFATAKFVGLIRDKESLFDSYSNQVLAVNNYSFFQSDWLTYGKANLLLGKPKINIQRTKPSLEALVESFEWMRKKHAELVAVLCDYKLEMVNGEHFSFPNLEGLDNTPLATALSAFRDSKPELKYGLDAPRIMANFFSLVSEREGLLISMSWRLTKLLRKIASLLRRQS